MLNCNRADSQLTIYYSHEHNSLFTLLISIKKNSISHKPDSVSVKRLAAVKSSFYLTKAVIYLAAALLRQSCCLPFSVHCCQCSKRAARLLFSTGDICDITACKVYPFRKLLCGTVSSYLTFSPLPTLREAVIFCGTFSCFYC